MKLYQYNQDPTFFAVYLTQKEVPIDEEFNIIKQEFRDKGFQVKYKTMGPSEDVYQCKKGTLNFELLFDLDYGTELKLPRAEDYPMLTRELAC